MLGCKYAFEAKVQMYVSAIAGVGFTLVIMFVSVFVAITSLFIFSRPPHPPPPFFPQFCGLLLSVMLVCNVSSIDSKYEMNDYK